VFARVGEDVKLIEVDASAGGFGRVLKVTPLAHVSTAGGSEAVVLAGGRYIVWLAPSAAHAGTDLFLFDRRTRIASVQSQFLPEAPPGLLLNGFSSLVADPRRPRLFLVEERVDTTSRKILWSLDPAAGAPQALFQTNAGVGTIRAYAYADLADELFISWTELDRNTLVVVDATTGQEKRRMLLPAEAYGLAVEPSGRYLWTHEGGRVRALDSRSGATLAMTTGGDLPTFHSGLGVLLLAQSALNGLGYRYIGVLDPAALTPLVALPLTVVPSAFFESVLLDLLPGRGAVGAYAARAQYHAGSVNCSGVACLSWCSALAVDAYDSRGVLRGTTDLLRAHGRPANTTCDLHALLVRSPFPPTALAASVTGNSATLQWDDPGDTLEFEVEVGVLPGRPIAILRVGKTRTVSYSGVPPGCYYVRVRAINELGRSEPSNEIRVVVM
jgi:hypothetical protein